MMLREKSMQRGPEIDPKMLQERAASMFSQLWSLGVQEQTPDSFIA